MVIYLDSNKPSGITMINEHKNTQTNISTTVSDKVLLQVEKLYFAQAKSFVQWIGVLKEMRGDISYIDATKTERHDMASLLGYKPSHLALASNSDENIVKKAYRDTENRIKKLQSNIATVISSLGAVSISQLGKKHPKNDLEWIVTSESGSKHILKVSTMVTSASRYKNVVRTTITTQDL